MNILFFLLQGIPESIGVFAFAESINKKVWWPGSILMGTILATMLYYIRLYFPSNGIHPIVAIFIILVYLTNIRKIPIIRSFLGTVLGFTFIIIFELITDLLLLHLFNLTVAQAASNDKLWTLIGMPQAILLLSAAIIISKQRGEKNELT